MEYTGKVKSFLKKHGMDPERVPLPEAVAGIAGAMNAGLSGEPSSLDMIPTYIHLSMAPPVGARAAVVDAGGTHFRAAHVVFTESGPVIDRIHRAPMPGSAGPATWDEFMDFTARELLPMTDDVYGVGFCFSYRAESTPNRDGRVIRMSKSVELTGYEGRLVCADLHEALRRAGARQLPITLINDTTAVLLSGADMLRTEGYDSLAGLVVGTGQNSCCVIDEGLIKKLGLPAGRGMLVNLESGCYDGIPPGDYDLELDAGTNNPGDHLFEKMTSGAYLGRLCLLTLRGAAREGMFNSANMGSVLLMNDLNSETAGKYALDASKYFRGRDALLVRDICHAIFSRAARLVCANLSAILTLTNKGLDPDHPACVCADGSVIRHSRVFAQELNRYMDSYTRAILGRHCVIRTMDEATTLGAAAAALLNG